MKTKRPMKPRRGGKKPSGKTLRTAKVQCCMTPEDAQWWDEFARDAGFQSRSQLMTTIFERLYLCRMQPFGAARLARQIIRRLEDRGKTGATERKTTIDFDFLRPLPALPEEAPISATPETEAPAKLKPATT